MPEFPISEDALRAAWAAVEGAKEDAVSEAIQAFLTTEGLEVEWSGELGTNGATVLFRDEADAREHLTYSPQTKLSTRLVSPWKPSGSEGRGSV